jgi:hypothetical protein
MTRNPSGVFLDHKTAVDPSIVVKQEFGLLLTVPRSSGNDFKANVGAAATELAASSATACLTLASAGSNSLGTFAGFCMDTVSHAYETASVANKVMRAVVQIASDSKSSPLHRSGSTCTFSCPAFLPAATQKSSKKNREDNRRRKTRHRRFCLDQTFDRVLGGTVSQLAARLQSAEMQAIGRGLFASMAPMVGLLSTTHGEFAVASAGVSLAFCPCLGMFECGFSDQMNILTQKFSIDNLGLRELEHGVVVATAMQGSLGLARMYLGDFFGGSYALLLAILGYNSRIPGPSSTWLRTYVLISFINGTMSSIDLVQQALNETFPSLVLSAPFGVNLAHMISFAVPLSSFTGAYLGWQHIKMQRKVAQVAYQQQVEHILRNPPWPPPRLPEEIVHSMLQQQARLSGAPSSPAMKTSALSGNEVLPRSGRSGLLSIPEQDGKCGYEEDED